MIQGNVLKFLFGATTVLYLQFIQSFLIHRGFSGFNLGYLYGASCVLDILVSIPTGVLADRYGVKPISLVGIVFLIVASFFSIISSGWLILLFGFVFYKIAESTLNGVISVWAKNLPTSNIGASSGSIFTRLDQWQRMGMIAMAIVVGFSIKDAGFSSRTAWIIAFIGTLFFFAYAFRTPGVSTHGHSKSLREVCMNVFNSFSSRGPLRLAMLAIFVLGLSEGLVGAKYWAWIRDIGITGPLAISIIVVLSSVSRVSGQFFFASKIKNEKNRFLLSLAAISLISFAFATPLPAVVLVTLWFLRIFCYSSYFPLLNKELEEVSTNGTHGTVLSAAPTINGIAAAISAIACSNLKINTPISFCLIGVFCTTSFVMWWRLKNPQFSKTVQSPIKGNGATAY